MPPVGAAIGAAFSAIGGALAGGAILTGLVQAAASFALSKLAQKLFGPKPPKPPGQTVDGRTTGELSGETFIVGRWATGGHMVYHGSHGDDGKTPNAFYTCVIELAGMPKHNLRSVILKGEFVEFDGVTSLNAITGDKLLPGSGSRGSGMGIEAVNDSLVDDAKAHFWLKFYDGTQTQADSFLTDRLTGGSHPFTSDMIGSGICYAVVTYRFSRKVWQSDIEPRFVLDGIPLYDPRKDSSVGGSGAHRFDNLATWEWTANPVVIAYNVARGITLPTGDVYGGEYKAADLPLDRWVACMNTCDETGGFFRRTVRYRFGAEVNVAETEPAELIEACMTACAGQIAAIGGKLIPQVGAPDVPVWSINDDDLSAEDQLLFEPIKGLAERFNGVQASHAAPAQLWEPRNLPLIENATWEAEDGGRRLIADLRLSGVFSAAQASELANIYINDERRQRVHQFVLPPDAARLQVFDTIHLTRPQDGYQDKLVEVVGFEQRTDDLFCAVTVREVDPADYEWTAGQDAPEPPVVLPEPILVQSVPGFGVEALVVLDGTTQPRRPALRLFWNPDQAEDVRSLRFEIRLAGGAVVASGVEAIEAGQHIAVLLPETAYEARAQLIANRRTEWTAWFAATTPDVRFEAPDLGVNILQTIADAQDIANQAGQDAQDAFTAAQAAADAVDAIDQQLLDDLADLLVDLDGLDPQDVVDARRRALLALRDGWLRDPTFQEWMGGNLAAANWVTRSGIATYGSQDKANGFYGSSLRIERPANTSLIQIIADTDVGLIGADAEAEFVVVSLLMEVAAVDLDLMRAQPEWREGAGSWQRGDAFGIDNASANFDRWGFTVRPGVIQGKQVLFRRPSGAWDQVRLRLQALTLTAYEIDLRVHAMNIRAATEAEIATFENAQDIAAEVTTRTTQFTGLTTSLAALDTQVNSRIGDAEGNISNLQTTKVDSAGASAIADTRIGAALATSPLGSIRATVNTQVATRTTPSEAAAVSDQRISASISSGAIKGALDNLDSDLSADINNLQTVKVDASGAIAAVNSTISAADGNTVATVSQRATTAVNRTGEIYARAFLGAQVSGGVGASIELISFNEGTGGSSSSTITLTGDNVIAPGTLSTSRLVVTDFSGNLVPDGAFKNGFNGKWGNVPEWSIVERDDDSSANAIRTAPTPTVLRMDTASANRALGLGWLECKPGERFNLDFDIATSGSGSDVDTRLEVTFFPATGTQFGSTSMAGAGLTTLGTGNSNYSGTGWTTRSTVITAPSDAAFGRIQIRRNNDGSTKSAYATNLSVVRQRAGTVLITPESITAPLILADSAFFAKLQAENGWIRNAMLETATIETAKIKDAAITNAKIGNLQVNAAKIANLAVDTIKIAGNAVSVIRAADVTSGSVISPSNTDDWGPWTTICSLTFTPFDNPDLIVWPSLILSRSGGGGDQTRWQWRNSDLVGSADRTVSISGAGATGGTLRIQIRARSTETTSEFLRRTVTIVYAALVAAEFKR